MRRFNNLPIEIMLEILTRLPTESVLECKLVCKPWKDLIHLPSFSRMHLNHLNSADDDSSKLSFVFLNRLITKEYTETHEISYAEYDENSHEIPFCRKKIMNVNLPFYDCRYHYSFAGSCNGLICIDSWHNDLYGPTYIFNPITREYIILPALEGEYWWTGFGYIPSTNEYKVVRIYNSCGDSNVRLRNVQVYTLGSNTGWRNVGTMDRIMQFYRRDAGAFVNGAIHWADDQGTILSFHLADEKFSKLPSPPWFPRSEFSTFPISLGVLGDFLSVTYCCEVGPSETWGDAYRSEIWLLKKNKHNNDFSWRKEFSFNGSRILWNSPLFGFTKTGRLLCYENHKIYGYDPKASSAKMDVNFGKLITSAIPHRNTLVSLKVLGEKNAKIMESGGTSEETENSDKLKKPLKEARDL